MSILASVSPHPLARARAEALARAHVRDIATRTDRLFAALLFLEWLLALVVAVIVSPRIWSGTTSHVHPHVWAALFLGAIIAVPSALIALRHPGETLSRHVVAIAQMSMSALLIYVTGGRIETHFHVFGSLAMLAFYRDWRVLVTATIVIAGENFVQGTLWPEALYGVASASAWRSLEHVWWVAFENTFLAYSCVKGRREIQEIANKRALLELARDVKKQRDEAEAANEAKSSFLANMSHEIRTPMTAILGFADLLLEQDLPAADRMGHIQIIRRNGRHLLALIDDILDLSKIEAGKMVTESVPSAPHRILADVASLMRPHASQKGVVLEVRYDGAVPSTVHTDSLRLRQIVMNLVSNAIKFTDRGRIEIVARHVMPGPGASFLEIAVTDSGIGIDRQMLQSIFLPFIQADGSSKRRFGGSGLGLAISARLAKMLGGEMQVRSELGRGSTFTVRIATGSLEGATMLHEYKECGPSSHSTKPAIRTLEGVRVLAVEDGPDNQLLISAYLRKAGATVELAENGRIGVDRALAARAAGEAFDVILMDMQMPVLDGYGAAGELRARGYRGPIIALTAHAMSGDRDRCIEAGCDDYATKPITQTDLVASVERHVRRGPPRFASSGIRVHTLPKPDDDAELVSDLANDADMKDIVEAFVRNMPGRAEDLRRCAEARDWDELARLAHHLKGAAGGYGFAKLGVLAAVLEHAVKTGDHSAARQHTTHLADLCLRARARATAKTPEPRTAT